MFRLTCYRHW